MNLGFSEVKPVVMPGEKVIDKNQNTQSQDDDDEQVAGIEERFSLKALFQNGQIQVDIDGQ